LPIEVLCFPLGFVELRGLVHVHHRGDNVFMTITFRDQEPVPAVLLRYDGDHLRALIPGEDDSSGFQRVNGVWVSDDCEPVHIEFAWERLEVNSIPPETDCICSKELATDLLGMLFSPEPDELPDELLDLFTHVHPVFVS